MGVKIVANGLSFFEQIGSNELLVSATYLAKAGVSFDISFFNVMFMKGGVCLSKAMLPKSTTSLLKGSMDAASKQLCFQELAKAMTTAGHHVGLSLATPVPPPTIEAFFSAPDYAAVAEEVPPIAKKKVAKKVHANGVIPLKDATDTLQKVRGTDTGSVYVAVGVGSAMNLAVRYKGTGVSFRVEFRKAESTAMVQALATLGFNKAQGGHWSMHFDVGNPNIQARVLGSVVSGLIGAGVKFDRSEIDISKVQGGA